MINKAKNRYSENGHLYLLWGWVILVCSLGHFVLENVFKIRQFYFVWFLTWAAVIYQFVYLRRSKRKRQVTTYTDEIIKYVWLVFIVMMVLLVVVVTRFSSHPANTDAVFLVLYGMPTFLSGIILKFRPLLSGGIFCWLLAILSLFVPYQYHMLFIAAAVIAAWIIPGFLLQSRFKNSHQ